MDRGFINPLELPNWEQSFSQVVVVPGGETRTVYVSGQVAVDRHNNIVGRGDLNAQARRAFENLRTALSAAGAAISDVVKLNIYVVGYEPSQAGVVREAMRSVFRQPPLPASTWLGVERLALDGVLIEVDAVAVVA